MTPARRHALPAEPRGPLGPSATSAWRWAFAATLLVATVPAVSADNCSGPADCEQTADYNNGIAVGGGIVAVIIATTVAGFAPPGTGAALLPGAPPVDPYTGDPLTVNDGTRPGGKKGDVWWPWNGGRWVGPDEIGDLIRRGNEEMARDQARSDATWEENKRRGWEATQKLGDKARAEAEAEQRAREAEEQAERNRRRREELAEQQQENFKEQEREGGWTTVKEEFWDKTTKEIDDLPRDVQNLGRDLVRGGFKAAEDLAKGLADPENWRIAAETAGGTAWDALTGPPKLLAGDQRTWDNVVNSVDTVTKVGGHIVNEIKKDPVEFVKGLTPIKAWEDAMDPNKPLIERIGRTWWATADTIASVGGIGKVIGKAGGKAAQAADDLADAAKTAFREGKLPPKVDPGKLKQLNDEWEKTRAIAKGKVTEYDRARRAAEEAAAKGDEAAAAIARQRQKDAAIKLQGDKVALQEINKRKPATIQSFKDDMKDVYDKTDDKMVDWAAREKGYGKMKPAGTTDDGARIFRDDKGNEIHIAEPTNPTKPGAKPKAGADRDYTMRSKDADPQWTRDPKTGKMVQPNAPPPQAKDLDFNKVQKEYNDRFFEAAGGKDLAKRTGLPDDPEAFTHKMDQLATGGQHPEMYGKTQRDLDAAIKNKGAGFSDSAQIGDAMAFKGDHWVGKGTQTDTFEGMRQTMKQFDNQAMGRMKAMDKHVTELKQAGLIDKDFAVKPPPPRIQEGVDIMRRVHADKNPISPAQAVEDLKKLGLTPQDVNRGVGDYVDSLQRAAPKVLRHQMGVP